MSLDVEVGAATVKANKLANNKNKNIESIGYNVSKSVIQIRLFDTVCCGRIKSLQLAC